MSWKLFLALLLFSTIPAEAAPFTVCYFSLNKKDEEPVAREFVQKLNSVSSVKIVVKEFQPDKADFSKDQLKKGEAAPNAAFKKMVESGTRCDGIVISGHHTGSWGGHRSNGRLSMDFMETLSCDPKYADFFRNVNAVWLQGCRTLGVGEIVPDNSRFDANYHTNRVGAVLEEDGLPQNFQQLNTEFSSTLDQDNPLDSRYLRLFPAAKLFGWTETAPGEKANSQFSVLYHIAHMARMMDAQDKFPDISPLSPTIDEKSALKYLDAVVLALGRMGEGEKGCEEITTKAWLAHGSPRRCRGRGFESAHFPERLRQRSPPHGEGTRVPHEGRPIPGRCGGAR